MANPTEDRARKLAPDRGRLAPTKLAHIVRRTSRFEEMLALVPDRPRRARSSTRTACSPSSPTTTSTTASRSPGFPGFRTSPRSPPGRTTSRSRSRDLGDLLYTYARLKREGIEPYWCINHGPTTSMYYKDPDGSRIELQVDNFPTAEETNRWMRSGEFAANPIGVVFDPEVLLARYRAGEPMATLVARPPLPEGVSPFDMLRF